MSLRSQMAHLGVLSFGMLGIAITVYLYSTVQHGSRDLLSIVIELLIIVLLIVLTVLCGTYAARQARLPAKNKKQTAVRMLDAANKAASTSDQQVAYQTIPSYWEMLRRNAHVTVLFLPFFGLLLLIGGWLFSQVTAKGDIAKTLYFLIASIGYGIATIIWGRAGRFVDRPGRTTQPDQMPGHQSFNPQPALPETEKLNWANLARVQREASERNTSQVKKIRSTADRVMARMFIIILVSCGVVVLLPVVVLSLPQAAAWPANARQTVTVLTLSLGIVGIFVMFRIMPFFMPKSPIAQYLTDYERLARTTQYNEMLIVVDKMLEAMPNYESWLPAAAAYATVGQIEKAKALIQRLLDDPDLLTTGSEPATAVNKQVIGTALGLLAAIQNADGHPEQADPTVEKALALTDSYPIRHIAARLALQKRDVVQAECHLAAAHAFYMKKKKQPSGEHFGLQAWLAALKGTDTAPLLTQATASIDPDYRGPLAELALIQAEVARVQHVSPERFLHEADRLDPKGINGIIARRELAAT